MSQPLVSSDRSVYWSVTINNPREDDEENIANARTRGWVVEGQKEVGENGTPHYQLMVNTRTQQRFTALKKQFPRAHIEQARKPTALKQYVHKQETRVAELQVSERYITSNKKLFDMVFDYLEGCEPPKQYRIMVGEERPYDPEFFKILDAFDHACCYLIRQGYYNVETMAVNPQVRSAIQKFWTAMLYRRQVDRQTDRQAELFSQQESINAEATEEVYENQSGETSEGDDDSSSQEDGSGDESDDFDSGEEFD